MGADKRRSFTSLSSKVLLAVRKMIKAASFAFFWEMMEKHTHNQLFR